MDTDIRARYIVQLATPFDIDSDLRQLPSPIRYYRDDYSAELKWGSDDFEWTDPLPDGSLDYGTVSRVAVDIFTQGKLIYEQGHYRLDEDTFNRCERRLITITRRFTTWVQVKTSQSWLNDRFPVHRYNAEFYRSNGTLVEKHDQRNPNRRFVSLHPHDSYSGLSAEHWASISTHFINDDLPSRLDYMLIEAKSLLDSGYSQAALVSAVTALQDYCQRLQTAPLQSISGGDADSENLARFIRGMASEPGFPRIDIGLVRKMIAIRNDLIHSRLVEVNSPDVKSLIHAILDLFAWKNPN